MWQITMTLVSILLIFGTLAYIILDSQIPYTKYMHSTVSGQPVRGHHNVGTCLTLTAILKKTQIFIH